MSEQWYYAQRGQQLGPVPTEVLTAMAAEGQLHPGDLVWKEGMANWVPAHSVPGLFAAPARPVRSAAEGYDVLPEAERPAPSYPEPEEEPEDYRPRRRPP